MPEGKGYKRLKAQTSLEDILVVATEFERTARDFYAGLVPKVSKRSDIAGQVRQSIRTPASDRRFSDCIHLPELGDHPDDQAVLQYALGREHAAMEQYRSLAESTPPGPIRDLFQYLADEETEHKNELEKRYYEIVHSGGV